MLLLYGENSLQCMSIMVIFYLTKALSTSTCNDFES